MTVDYTRFTRHIRSADDMTLGSTRTEVSQQPSTITAPL